MTADVSPRHTLATAAPAKPLQPVATAAATGVLATSMARRRPAMLARHHPTLEPQVATGIHPLVSREGIAEPQWLSDRVIA